MAWLFVFLVFLNAFSVSLAGLRICKCSHSLTDSMLAMGALCSDVVQEKRSIVSLRQSFLKTS